MCQRPGCAVPTLISRWALDRHAAATGVRPLWLPDISLRPQYSTRWNLNGAQAAHVAAGNSGLSRSDLKAPSAQIDLQFGQLHLSSLRVTPNLATTPAGDYQMILLDRPRALSKSNSIGDVQSSKVNVSELSDDPSGFQRCWVRAPSLYFPICCSYKILSEQVDDIVSRWVCAGRPTYITLKWIKERCRSCGEISTKAIRFVWPRVRRTTDGPCGVKRSCASHGQGTLRVRGEIFGSALLVFSGQASGRYFGSQCAETG